MSHKHLQKKQTTIPPSDQPRLPNATSQPDRRPEQDRVSTVEANKNSATRDNTRSISDQPNGMIDLGSRWCPEEIEIFFTCKCPKTFSMLISNLTIEFQKYGVEWQRILDALHCDEFLHRNIHNVIGFYEQVSSDSTHFYIRSNKFFKFNFISKDNPDFNYFKTTFSPSHSLLRAPSLERIGIS